MRITSVFGRRSSIVHRIPRIFESISIVRFGGGLSPESPKQHGNASRCSVGGPTYVQAIWFGSLKHHALLTERDVSVRMFSNCSACSFQIQVVKWHKNQRLNGPTQLGIRSPVAQKLVPAAIIATPNGLPSVGAASRGTLTNKGLTSESGHLVYLNRPPGKSRA